VNRSIQILEGRKESGGRKLLKGSGRRQGDPVAVLCRPCRRICPACRSRLRRTSRWHLFHRVVSIPVRGCRLEQFGHRTRFRLDPSGVKNLGSRVTVCDGSRFSLEVGCRRPLCTSEAPAAEGSAYARTRTKIVNKQKQTLSSSGPEAR